MSTSGVPLLPENWRQPEREAFLADMGEAVRGEPYPGYPAQADRLYIPPAILEYTADGRPVFPADPDAPYTVFDHSVDPPNPRPAHAFHDTGGPLPVEEQQKIVWGDMRRDSRGFPRHRYAVDMVTDPAIGGIIGPGYYYHPGKIRTADVGVVARGVPAGDGRNEYGITPAVQASPEQLAVGGLYLCLLVVKRTDTGQFALPGGEIDEGEDAHTAALRELREETGLSFDSAVASSLGRFIVADPRLTTCTEAETELFAVDAGTISDKQPRGDEDEVEVAEWIVADSSLLGPRGRFFGSHRRLAFATTAWYQARYNVTIMDNGRIVPNGDR